MATTEKEILMNNKRGSDVDILYPVTKASLVVCGDGETIEEKIAKLTIPTTPSEVGAMPASEVVTAFWKGTQIEYDAIAIKNETTLYLIIEEE